MDLFVFLAVMAAAALHAGWNALIKLGLDRFLSVTLVSLGAGLLSLAVVPFVTPPPPAAWPWLGLSVLLHSGYKLFLVQAYRAGDLGQVYPIARGTAPLLVALAMLLLFGERLSPPALLGVLLLAGGVCLMSLRGGRDLARLDGRAVGFALGTAVWIAGYSVTDGIGARAAGSPHGYAVWLFLLDGLVMLALAAALRGRCGLAALPRHWRGGLAGGAMSFGAYWIVIWAMTVAPIALVAALRESSVLFAAAISLLLLKEPLSPPRAAAAAVIVFGLVLARGG